MHWQARLFRLAFTVMGLAGALVLIASQVPVTWAPVLMWCLLGWIVTRYDLGFPSPRGVYTVEWAFVLAVLAGPGMGLAALVALSAMAGRIRRERRRDPEANWAMADLAFEAALVVLAVRAAAGALAFIRASGSPAAQAAELPLASMAVFATLELPRASAWALAEGKRLISVWRERSLWKAPYYLVSAAAAGLMLALSPLPPLPVAIFSLPLFALLSRSFQAHVGGVEQERKRAVQVTALQTGMLEALAMAVEARESGGNPHVHRIAKVADLLGRAMGLGPAERQALELAALLHDIGKMAVPDYILSKPGQLLPEEFERLKLHPVVAAEIVERARFPFPVAPMVRSHHERWDGKGYPDGLAGRQIPLGGRILAVVDALDALLSERSYRRALPLPQALEAIERDAGAAYDPDVVQAVRDHAAEIEGVLRKPPEPDEEPPEFLRAIADAHREEQQVQELLEQISTSRDFGQVMPMIEKRLQRIVPHHTAAVWLHENNHLVLHLAFGRDQAALKGARLPLGEGVSGRSAARKRAMVNLPIGGEFSLAIGTSARHAGHTAVAAPFVTEEGLAGVMTLYGPGQPEFQWQHARLLMAFAPRFVSWLESVRRVQQAEAQASQDALTGLPNASALFLKLQQEIARNHREGGRLAVLVCDLDGFKGVNDTFGHLAGNDVLRRVAAGLRERCREYDFVARMGGDEFVILLPGIGAEPIDDRILSFSRAVTEAGRQVCGHPAVSLSVGVAYFPADGASPDELLARGDERMYANKRIRKARGHLSPDTAHSMYPGV
jgi:diguanylate cyclase (GGDEF)-like protein/putative nucleotidyltransferase with HDIG domain